MEVLPAGSHRQQGESGRAPNHFEQALWLVWDSLMRQLEVRMQWLMKLAAEL